MTQPHKVYGAGTAGCSSLALHSLQIFDWGNISVGAGPPAPAGAGADYTVGQTLPVRSVYIHGYRAHG